MSHGSQTLVRTTRYREENPVVRRMPLSLSARFSSTTRQWCPLSLRGREISTCQPMTTQKNARLPSEAEASVAGPNSGWRPCTHYHSSHPSISSLESQYANFPAETNTATCKCVVKRNRESTVLPTNALEALPRGSLSPLQQDTRRIFEAVCVSPSGTRRRQPGLFSALRLRFPSE